MFDLLFIVSIVGSIVQIIKEHNTKTIPAENWANKELYHKDIMNGVPDEQLIKNVENGKYKLVEKYEEPHKNPITGEIVIENCKLYYEDLSKYDAYEVKKWVRQGKYNLTPEELVLENKRIKEKYDKLLGLN